MTIAVTYARPSGFGKAVVTRGPDKGLLRYWPQLASFGLHGALLAAALLALREPSPEPVNAAAPVIAVEFVAAPAPAPTLTDSQVPAPEPQVQEPVASSSAAVEDVPVAEEPSPVPESTAAEIVPSPPTPKPKPEVRSEPKPKPKPEPEPRPVKAQEKPQTKAQPEPRGAPSQETSASVMGVEGSTQPTALQQAAMPIVAPPAVIAPPADYVGLIRAQLERNKVYPRTAQQRRQQGRAMLRIVIDRGGRVLSYKLEQGTGHDVLDREVVAMIQRASPLPPILASIAGERLELVVPVEFFLR